MTGEVASGDVNLKRIDDAVDSYNTGKGAATIMTIYEKMEAEYNKGLEQGLEQGLQQERSKMIKAMNASGMAAEEIAKIAEINLEEVEAILSE